MAKKSGRQKLDFKLVDTFLDRLYDFGVFHSTIFHSVIFILLALAIIEEPLVKPIKLELSFDSSSEQNLLLEEIPNIEISNDEPSGSDSKQEALDIAEKVVSFSEENIQVEYTTSVEDYSESENNYIQSLETKELYKELPSSITKKKDIKTKKIAKQTGPNNIIDDIREGLPHGTGDNDLLGGGHGMGDIQQRLNNAGAKTGDIQVSISWDTTDDIDVHVKLRTYQGISSYISWTSRVGLCGGMLDVDMNANPGFLTNKPVENIFWPKGNAPYGEFIVSIHNFRNWSGLTGVPVTVVIKVDERTQVLKVNAVSGAPITNVYRFNRTLAK